MTNKKLVILLKLFSVVLILIVTCSNIYSQGSLETIELDFNSKKFADNSIFDKIEDGNFYQLKIKNINTNIYKISIFTQDTILESELKFPTFAALSLTNLTELTKLGFEDLKAQDFQNQNDEENDVITVSNKKQEYILGKKPGYDSLVSRTDNLYFKIDSIFLSTQKEEKNNTTNTSNYKSILDTLNNLRRDIVNLQNDISENEKTYNTFIIDNIGSVKTDEIKEIVKVTKTMFTTLISAVSKLSEAVNAENSKKLLMVVISADNNKNNQYISLPFRLRGDLASLEISISPRDSGKLNLQSYKTRIEFPNRRVSNFSLGSAFYFSTLFNGKDFNNYSVTKQNDSTYEISNSGSSSEFGFLALINYFPTKSNFMISMGPGFSISETIRPRLAIGLGYGFGKRNLAVVNAGVILGLNEVLNSGYSTDSSYSFEPTNINSLNITSAFYFSFGYSFSF